MRVFGWHPDKFLKIHNKLAGFFADATDGKPNVVKIHKNQIPYRNPTNVYMTLIWLLGVVTVKMKKSQTDDECEKMSKSYLHSMENW